MRRREYSVSIRINGVSIRKVIIDPHFEEKHADSVNDELILSLVKSLDGETIEPEHVDPPFMYFKSDPLYFEGKKYRLIWLLEDNEIYVGVINAYRRS